MELENVFWEKRSASGGAISGVNLWEMMGEGGRAPLPYMPTSSIVAQVMPRPRSAMHTAAPASALRATMYPF